jgi:hypothetical protein
VVVSKRDVLRYLHDQKLPRGPMSMGRVKVLKTGPVARHLRSKGARAAEALDAALWHLHEQEFIELPADYRRARPRGRTVAAVLAACEDWIDKRCTEQDWGNVTAAKARKVYKTQHRNAGGTPHELTLCINNKLLSLAFQGRLHRVTKAGDAPHAVSMFSGTQSTTVPFTQAGYAAVWNAEITQRIDMGSRPAAIVQHQVDLSGGFKGKWGDLVAKVVAAWPKARDMDLSLLAAGIPCRTFVMNQVNSGRGHNFRSVGGNPRPTQSCTIEAHLAKKELAQEHDALAEDVMDSIRDWLLSAAIHGRQRHFIVENPARSMLWGRPYMEQFCALSGCTRQNVNYCCYRVLLSDECVYPCLKDTSILTNIQGWQPRKCPDRQHHDAHTCKIAGSDGDLEPEFLGIPKAACRYMTPEELYLDLAVAARS